QIPAYPWEDQTVGANRSLARARAKEVATQIFALALGQTTLGGKTAGSLGPADGSGPAGLAPAMDDQGSGSGLTRRSPRRHRSATRAMVGGQDGGHAKRPRLDRRK